MLNDRIDLGLRTSDRSQAPKVPSPTPRTAFSRSLPRLEVSWLSPHLCRPSGRGHKGVSRDRPAHLRRILVPIVKMLLNVFQIRLGLIEHFVGHFVAFGLCKSERVGDVNGQERIFISFLIALPQTKAAVVTLPRLSRSRCRGRNTCSVPLAVGISFALNASAHRASPRSRSSATRSVPNTHTDSLSDR